jgi:hypothetical protein
VRLFRVQEIRQGRAEEMSPIESRPIARHYRPRPLAPIGNLTADHVVRLAELIAMRATGLKGDPVLVYVDHERDVYALSEDASRQMPDTFLIGAYNRKASIGDIARDLMEAKG